jgi:predicted chitinase
MARQYITPEQISKITQAPLDNVRAAWPLICDALEQMGINHPLVQVGMAATIAVETGTFKPCREGRSANDGGRNYALQEKYWHTGFYGRGYIQLTWAHNYVAAGTALGLDLVGNPDLALQPKVAAQTAAWFFLDNGVCSACFASDWEAVRKIVNGPKYHQNQATLQRMIGWCKLLAGYAMGGEAADAPEFEADEGMEAAAPVEDAASKETAMHEDFGMFRGALSEGDGSWSSRRIAFFVAFFVAVIFCFLALWVPIPAEASEMVKWLTAFSFSMITVTRGVEMLENIGEKK